MFIGELEEYSESIHLLKLWQEELMLEPNGLNTAYAVFSHLNKSNRSRLSTLTCEHLEAMIRSQGQGPGIQKVSNGVTNSRCFQKVHIVSIHILKSSPTSKLS